MKNRRNVRCDRFTSTDALERRVLLTTVVVSNLSDSVNAADTSSVATLIANDGGDGISLREAVLATNNQPGADIIEFDESMYDREIVLGGTELEITDSVSIRTSADYKIFIQGNGASRVINFTAASGDLTLENLIIQGGNIVGDGAGVRFGSSGILSVLESYIGGNTAGTPASAGDGAGIYALGSVVIVDSMITSNQTYNDGRGGGIYVDGDLTMRSSQIRSNQAAEGGGVYVTNGTHHVRNSSISENGFTKSGGGIFSTETSSLEVHNSTLTASHSYPFGPTDGGGIHALGNLTVANSIVAQNDADAGIDLQFDDAKAVSFSYSLIGTNDATSLSESQAADSNGNLIGGSVGGPIDPQLLDSVSIYGFPNYVPLAGSPVIDAGDPAFADSTIPDDLRGRGFPRVLGETVDMGATEGAFVGLSFDRLAETLFAFGNGDSNKLVITEATARFGSQRLPVYKVKLDGEQWTVPGTSFSSIDVRMFGGADKVTIKVTPSTSVSVSAGGGNDVIRLKGDGGGLVNGGGGKDKLTGGNGPDTLNGGSGNDSVNGGRGDDILSGDGGEDVIKAGADNDLILGGAGDDVLNGGGGRDVLIGGLGSDVLDGKGGDDILVGATTAHDDTESNLKSIMQKWLADTDVQTRIDDIRDSNDTDLFLGHTIIDDFAFDKTTSDAPDWAFQQDLDELFGGSDFLNAT